MSMDPQIVFASGLLLVTIHDAIKGFSTDLFAPLLETILPGELQSPILFGKVRMYPTRFAVRLANVVFALAVVRYMKTNKLRINI